jgi:hypothetical protein
MIAGRGFRELDDTAAGWMEMDLDLASRRRPDGEPGSVGIETNGARDEHGSFRLVGVHT